MGKITSADDPRGLIAEAYKMTDTPAPECRSIFLDWALEPRNPSELRAAAARLLQRFAPEYPAHPMTGILQESLIELTQTPKRRGRRR